MNRLLSFTLILLLWVGTAYGETIVRFGVITDIHHTDKPDLPTHKYSASLIKTSYFVGRMNRVRADFIIELGDFVDTLADGTDPIQNLEEIEAVFTGFSGPAYHVLGNHEFDNLARSELLSRLNNTGIAAGKTYYSFDQKGIHCIVLDADYTVTDPHLPFDLQTPEEPFWSWTDAWIPQEEFDWLAKDLAQSNLPTVVFAHQLLHRDSNEVHTIKNAKLVRNLLEKDGQVLAVFSGHDHRGEITINNSIHYFVIKGNVGMSLDWAKASPTNGYDARQDSQFVIVEIVEKTNKSFNGMKSYQVTLSGNGRQYSFMDQIPAVDWKKSDDEN